MITARLSRIAAMMALFLISLLADAQVVKTNSSPNAEVDYARLKRIDTVINEYISKGWEKAVVALVLKDNQLVLYKGYGAIDVAGKKPIPPDAIFRIMSQTKAIVSAGAMILFEQGKFLLDEPIADFIPEFRHPKVIDKFNAADSSYTTVPAKREITFRDLLTHTSGLDYPDIGGNELMSVYAKAGIPSGLGYFDADLLTKMKALGSLPLAHQPGAKWTYGLNCDLLGCLIEVISGMNLEDFLRKHLFEPIGMKDTYFNVPGEKANRMATVFTEDSLQHIIPWSHTYLHIDPDYPLMKKHYFSGGAGLSSTALDYAQFLQMLLNGGTYNGHSILAPRTVELMLRNQIGDLSLEGEKFGLGFMITTEHGAANGSKSVGSFSWGGYYGTVYWADPQKKLVCLIMTQHNPNSHGDLTAKFENLVYQSLKK